MSGVNPQQRSLKPVYRNFPNYPSTFSALNLQAPDWKTAKDKRDKKVRLYNEQILEAAQQTREKYVEEQNAQEDRDRNAQEDRDRNAQEDRDRNAQEDRDRDRDQQGPRKRLEEVQKNTGRPTQHPDAPVTMRPPPGLPAPVTMRPPPGLPGPVTMRPPPGLPGPVTRRGVALPGDVANLRTTERAESFLSTRLHTNRASEKS